MMAATVSRPKYQQGAFCISPRRSGTHPLISVIMAGPDSKTRFRNAAELLNHYFWQPPLPYVDENWMRPGDKGPGRRYGDGSLQISGRLPVSRDTKGVDFSAIEKEVLLEEELTAPIEKGEAVGKVYYQPEREILGKRLYPSQENQWKRRNF